MVEKSKIKTKNWRDNSKNHPLRFPFLHLYKQEIKIFQDYFFLFPNPQNSVFLSSFSAVFFAARLNPALGDQKQQSFNFSAKQDIHSLYICLWDDIWETAVLLEITWYMWVFFVWHSAELIRNSIFLSKDGVYVVVATFFLPLCAMYVRQ